MEKIRAEKGETKDKIGIFNRVVRESLCWKHKYSWGKIVLDGGIASDKPQTGT